AGRLRTAVEKNSYVLVEAVAEELARAALAAAGARTVSVRVRKKVLAGIDDVEVEINRSA
ncbi:MAG TPA: dihydroneopterin aldolase, partial [Elusimicrobiota bacterium]|nr:dihydroneopterin aldolase [Elusimicrobiota bacterium]